MLINFSLLIFSCSSLLRDLKYIIFIIKKKVLKDTLLIIVLII